MRSPTPTVLLPAMRQYHTSPDADAQIDALMEIFGGQQ